VEHQEIRHENTGALEGTRSFSVCTLGGGFPLSVRAAVILPICKEILEHRQIEWRLHTAQVLPEILTTSAWIFLIVRRAGGDLSPFRDKCCGRNQHVENLPPYADWVVIGPVGSSKASVTRASRYL
jgi:hypothetical protein